MFSANENIALRQHKRRIIQFVEECIPEDVLDLGTTVMVMQVSCKAPGCVPLETLVYIVFPKVPTKNDDDDKGNELIPGLPESSSGGTYKTKILMPMAQVTKDDVLEALPVSFVGGRRSMQKLCAQVRDVMLGQISQICSDDDIEGKTLVAKYLQQCLEEYMQRECVPPDYGQEYPPLVETNDVAETATEATTVSATSNVTAFQGTGNILIRRVVDDDDSKTGVGKDATPAIQSAMVAVTQSTQPNPIDTNNTPPIPTNNITTNTTTSATAWRKQVDIDKAFSSQSIISRLSEREHAPGVRSPGCPCCDPDSASNYVDSMMML